MRLFADLVLLGWVPVVLLMFYIFPPRRAAIIAVIGGWLFLPWLNYELPGLPDYTRVTAISLGVLLGALVFDGDPILTVRARWFDLPVIAFCICPLFSSISNGLGLYDGLSSVLTQFVAWGIPYLVGRTYFGNIEGVCELAVGVVIGALLYVPFCLFENRMSPRLHYLVYGFNARTIGHFMQRPLSGTALEGWRPIVFLECGLAVCIFMSVASLLGVWLWRCGTIKKLGGIPVSWLIPPLIVTTILCRGVGSIAVLIMGLSTLFITKWSRSRIAVILLALSVPSYYAGRISGVLNGEGMQTLVATFITVEKAESLAIRQWQESVLMRKILSRPLFGWGQWGRYRGGIEVAEDDPYNTGTFVREGNLTSVDSFWLFTFGTKGFLGLIAFTAVLLVPVSMVIRRVPGPMWASSEFGPITALATALIIVLINFLFDGLFNLIVPVAAGALTKCAAEPGFGTLLMESPQVNIPRQRSYGPAVPSHRLRGLRRPN